MLSKDERQKWSKQLYEDAIKLVNDNLIPPHHADQLKSAEVISIAAEAFCRAIITVMFSQSYSSGKQARLIDSFCAMFRKDCETYLEHLQIKDEDTEDTEAPKPEPSAWE